METGKVTCPKCGGRGKVTCWSCSGAGGRWETSGGEQEWEKCSLCWGSGESTCSDCNGWGTIAP